jgi:predicted phage terminase large subunit-like protein
MQEAALACEADIAVLGGAAGAGKSWVSAVEAMRNHDVPGFAAVIFRRTYPELVGPESIWEQTARLYPTVGGHGVQGKLTWTFRTKDPKNPATVKLDHLQHETDISKHQSKAYALVIFEEATHFSERQIWYLISRMRSTSGVVPYMRLTCNPDPDSHVAELIGWWLDDDGYPIPERAGVIRWLMRVGDTIVWGDSREELREKFPDVPDEDFDPKTFTFLPGRLEENIKLLGIDPGYRGRLNLLDRVTRERLLKGNWKIRAEAGLLFSPGFFEIIDELPAPVEREIRFWDKAATEPSESNKDPDWTAGVKMARLKDGRVVVIHAEHMRGRPAAVDRRMTALASQDGVGTKIGVFQDPGQAGKVDIEHMKRLLRGYRLEVVRPTKNKIVAASPWSAYAEQHGVLLMRGDWNQKFITEHAGFPDSKHDDLVDAAAAAFTKLHKRTLSLGVVRG